MKNTIKILTILYLLLQQVPHLHAQNPTQILNQLSSLQVNNRSDLIKKLSQQKTGDYSLKDKEQFQEILRADSLSHYDQLLRIAGQVGIGEDKLYELSINNVTYILPIDTSENHTFYIIYGEDKVEGLRPYELVAIDAEKGLYKLDEKNSIAMEGYLLGNGFYQSFEVMRTTLMTIVEKINRCCHVFHDIHAKMFVRL